MECTILREQLLNPLQQAAAIIDKRHPNPILGHVHLKLSSQYLNLSATDLEAQLDAIITVENVRQTGEVLVSVRKLLDIVRSLPDGAAIELKQSAESLIVKSGRARFVLASLNVADLPRFTEDMPANLELTLNVAELLTLIDKTHFAMAQQDVRYYLNGIYFEGKQNQLRSVASDGHRLATCVQKLNNSYPDFHFILPRKAIQELTRIFDNAKNEVDVAIAKNYIRFKGDTLIFTTKVIDSAYPRYENVIPKQIAHTLTVERLTLKNALVHAAIMAGEKLKGVRWHMANNILRVFASNTEHEEAVEEMDVQYDGKETEIAFNVQYLLDVVNALNTPQIQFSFNEAFNCVMIESKDADGAVHAIYVIMPMKL
jgi:DNA polymerase-3 subunit beta